MCLLSLGASNHVSDAKSRETQRLLLVSPIRPAFGSILKQNDPWLLKTHIQLVPFFLLLSFFPSLPNPLLFPFHFPVFFPYSSVTFKTSPISLVSNIIYKIITPQTIFLVLDSLLRSCLMHITHCSLDPWDIPRNFKLTLSKIEHIYLSPSDIVFTSYSWVWTSTQLPKSENWLSF